MPEKRYVLNKECVRQSLDVLRDLKIHRTFAGYLCLREAAHVAGKRTALKPDFGSFFDRYLRVAGASPNAPYAVPFNDRGSAIWFNPNVAGSYAPSSLRAVSPLRRVADIFGRRADHTFALKDDDARLCLEHLLNKEPVPVLPLAAFLFREYGLEPEPGESPPTANDLVLVFREKFGFRTGNKDEDADFNILFDTGRYLQMISFEEARE
jgi:hypothetical protein